MARAADTSAIGIYRAHAGVLAPRYDAVATGDVFAPVLDLLPPPTAMLDVGAGSGRDAQWFAARGYQVTAAEPVAEFRAAIAKRAPDVAMVDARLPALTGMVGPFGLILVNTLWHHLDDVARDQAMSRLAGLLTPAGRLIISLRHGPLPEGQPVHALDPEAEARRAALVGLGLLRFVEADTHQEQNIAAGVSWTWLVLGKETLG
jgi:SAM-dependent methyltransferase